MAKIPKALSVGEEEFALHCKCYKVEVEREFIFHPTRKWRFDFVVIDCKIAVEIEGGTRNNGRHNRHAGFTADCQKYAEAAILGWIVIRATTEMVHSGAAIDLVMRAIDVRLRGQALVAPDEPNR